MLDSIERLLDTLGSEYQEVVIRSHFFTRNSVLCRDGELDETTTEKLAGIGIRVLTNGSWGFASFSGSKQSIADPKGSLERALRDATKISRVLSSSKGQKTALAPMNPSVGKFQGTSISQDPTSLEEIMTMALNIDKTARNSSELIKSTGVVLGTIREKKELSTLSGTRVEVLNQHSELSISLIAARNGKLESFAESLGTTGSIEDLSRDNDFLELATRTANMAIRKLDARIPPAGMHEVIMDPGIVGLLCHEAIGHTVEADFVLSGSITKGKLGEFVANPTVTMIDSGRNMGGAGWLPIDDEGVQASDTILIDKGILCSYLHNRETAAIMDVDPTGNARAGGYSREPIIRMTNTFLQPGNLKREDIIEDTKNGILLTGAGSGEADSNAEFVFDVAEAYPIQNGEIKSKELFRGVAISGNAFETLKSVSAIGNNFKLEMGTGACLKGGQPVKVDGGGPSIRCEVRIAGRNQEVLG
ncbi:MAG: TldD/PmbA family protein [Candidatus Hodarchaeales archaeon]|jgi:TldD protein